MLTWCRSESPLNDCDEVTAPYSLVGPYSTNQSVLWFSGTIAPCTVVPLAPPEWTVGAEGRSTRTSSTSLVEAPSSSVTVSVGK